MLLFLLLLTSAVLQDIDLADYLAPEPARVESEKLGREETFDPESGLLLHRSRLETGDTIDYERPVVILPPRLTVGESHVSQRRFVRRDGETKRDVGSHSFTARILRVEDRGRFTDCLVVQRSEVRMDYSGALETVEVTEWYARDVGVIEADGRRERKGPDGETVASEPIRRRR